MKNTSNLMEHVAEITLWHAYSYLQSQNRTGLSTDAMRLIRQILNHDFAHLYLPPAKPHQWSAQVNAWNAACEEADSL